MYKKYKHNKSHNKTPSKHKHVKDDVRVYEKYAGGVDNDFNELFIDMVLKLKDEDKQKKLLKLHMERVNIKVIYYQRN